MEFEKISNVQQAGHVGNPALVPGLDFGGTLIDPEMSGRDVGFDDQLDRVLWFQPGGAMKEPLKSNGEGSLAEGEREFDSFATGLRLPSGSRSGGGLGGMKEVPGASQVDRVWGHWGWIVENDGKKGGV